MSHKKYNCNDIFKKEFIDFDEYIYYFKAQVYKPDEIVPLKLNENWTINTHNKLFKLYAYIITNLMFSTNDNYDRELCEQVHKYCGKCKY